MLAAVVADMNAPSDPQVQCPRLCLDLQRHDERMACMKRCGTPIQAPTQQPSVNCIEAREYSTC